MLAIAVLTRSTGPGCCARHGNAITRRMRTIPGHARTLDRFNTCELTVLFKTRSGTDKDCWCCAHVSSLSRGFSRQINFFCLVICGPHIRPLHEQQKNTTASAKPQFPGGESACAPVHSPQVSPI